MTRAPRIPLYRSLTQGPKELQLKIFHPWATCDFPHLNVHVHILAANHPESLNLVTIVWLSQCENLPAATKQVIFVIVV